MDLTPKAPSKAPVQVLKNPTDSQRHAMTRAELQKDGRPEDFEYLMGQLCPPEDITTFGAPGQYKGVKVAVVGAGAAGLCAAFELRKLGFDITIIEAEEERIGGRVLTHYFDADKKLYGELGASRVPAIHETAWHYINLFNLNTTRLPLERDTFIYVSDVRVRNNSKEIMEKIYPLFNLTPDERNTPWPQLYTNVLHSSIKRLPPEIRAEVFTIQPEHTATVIRSVAVNVRDVLKDAGLSDVAISLITSLSPTVNAFINGSYFTEFITEYGLFMRNAYRLDGGMANLPLAFYKSLTSENPQEYNIPKSALGKVTFKMGSWVKECYKSDRDGKVVLKYNTRLNPDGIYDSYDYVFFTIPLTALRKMNFFPPLSNLKMEAIREAFYVDAQKTLLLCSERFWEKQDITGGASNTDMIIQTILYPPDHAYCEKDIPGSNSYCSPDEPGVLTASYNIGNDAVRLGNTSDYRFLLTKRFVERVHGLPENYLDKIVMDYITVNWNRNEWITGAFLNLLPGQGIQFGYELFRPDYDNRVYLAGEANFPPQGWLQAAFKAAMMASNALAYYLKLSGHK